MKYVTLIDAIDRLMRRIDRHTRAQSPDRSASAASSLNNELKSSVVVLNVNGVCELIDEQHCKIESIVCVCVCLWICEKVGERKVENKFKVFSLVVILVNALLV